MSLTVTVVSVFGCVWSTTCSARSGSPAPVIRTRTRTSCSGLSPWLAIFTANVTLPVALMLLAASGVSVLSPTLTATRPWPCSPGVGSVEPPSPAPRPACASIRLATVEGCSQPRFCRKLELWMTCPVISLSSSTCLMSAAVRRL